MEPSKPSFFNQLPDEIILQIIGSSVGTSQKVNNRTAIIANTLLKNVNSELVKQYPLLDADYQMRKEADTPGKLFMRLINLLHDEADDLGCDVPAPKNLQLFERINWEYNHCVNLAAKVNQEYIKNCATMDFEKFVEAVAKQMGVNLPNLSSEANAIKIAWESLLKDPRITSVQELDLSMIPLTTLPPEIGQLTQLKKLILTLNLLTKLPPEIGKLSKLEILSLQNNKLENLPHEISSLTNLRTLDLSINLLQKVPPEIYQLKKLEKLDLSFNKLNYIPPSIERKFGVTLESQRA